MQGEEFVRLLKGVKRVGEGSYLAFCPAHDNHNTQALSVTLKEDRTLVNDFGGGCTAAEICGALGRDIKELFYDYDGNVHSNGQVRSNNGATELVGHSEPSGISLERFASAKGLPAAFLTQHGVAMDKKGLKFHHKTMTGQRAARQHIRLYLDKTEPRFIWSDGKERPGPYGLWRIGEMARESRDLYLLEGESDTLTLWFHGFNGIGLPGATNTDCLQEGHVASFSRIFIVKEEGNGGQQFLDGCTVRLGALGFDGEVKYIAMAGTGVKDTNELHLAAGLEFQSRWLALTESAQPVELPLVGLELSWASAIKAEPISWLWPERIPLGQLTVFAGDPQLGKSFVTLDIAAQASTGAWGPACDTLIFSGEDSAQHVIVPRLLAMGADMNRVGIVALTRKASNGEIVRRPFNLATDLDDLRKKLKKYREVKLVIIDPMTSYLGGINGNTTIEMRSLVLSPLATLAQDFGIAVILVMHLNKDSSTQNPLYRISGSLATVAAARMAWAFVGYGKNQSAMVLAKSNITAWVPGLSFHIEAAADAGIVLWGEKPILATLQELMNPAEEEK